MQEWNQDLTKHGQILKYIENLKVGSKISVRRMAKDLDVSEGTAYRAIKDAESQGWVSTKERIGTVRIEKKKSNINRLTFAEVVQIVDGDVVGGERGLSKTLHKFVIGAMERDDMRKYIDAGSLLIVGNRIEAHICALEEGAGVLITGGFGTSAEVKEMADKLEMPIISCAFDTFTVASMINRAISDNLIKKKIMLVEDIISPKDKLYLLRNNSTLMDWERLLEETGYTRFPVVDDWNRVVGMVTSKDVIGAKEGETLDKYMTRHPQTVNLLTSVTAAAHLMMWEGIELLPVIDSNRKLIGTISRQDVLKAMQYSQRQPELAETLEDMIWNGFSEARNEQGELVFEGIITPQMTNHLGTVSEGVLTTLMAKAVNGIIRDYKKGDLVIENMSCFFIKPLQIESEVKIKPRIIDLSRKFGKLDVEITHKGHLICKAMLTAQVMHQS